MRQGTNGGAHRRRVRALAAVVALGLLLAACAGGDDASRDMAVSESAPSPEPMDDMMEAPGDFAPDADFGDAVEGEMPQAAPGVDLPEAAGAPDTRQVIRTADLVLEVLDGGAVAEEAEALAIAAGGFLSAADLSRDTDGIVRGSLTLRVPSDRLLEIVDALDALAEATPVRRVDELDVTTELTDIDARLVNLRAYEDELRDLLSEVRGEDTDTTRLLLVFDQLNQVRLDIEMLEARQSALSDQVALSTITVQLVPAGSALPVVDAGWSPMQTVRDATASLLRGLSQLADFLIWFGITGIPVLLLIAALFAIPFLLIRRWLRRREQQRPAPAVAPAAAMVAPAAAPAAAPGAPSSAAAAPAPTGGPRTDLPPPDGPRYPTTSDPAVAPEGSSGAGEQQPSAAPSVMEEPSPPSGPSVGEPPPEQPQHP